MFLTLLEQVCISLRVNSYRLAREPAPHGRNVMVYLLDVGGMPVDAHPFNTCGVLDMDANTNSSKFYQAAVITVGGKAVGTISLYVDQASQESLAALTGAGISKLLTAEGVSFEAPKVKSAGVDLLAGIL